MNDGHNCVPSASTIMLIEQPHSNHENKSHTVKMVEQKDSLASLPHPCTDVACLVPDFLLHGEEFRLEKDFL